MARKTQSILNYRTATKNMPLSGDVQHGEIVVRYATDQPELLIKKENQEFATFVDKEAVKTLIDASLATSAGSLKSFSAAVVSTYATSADTVAAINQASGAIQTTINNLSGNVVTYVEGVSGNIQTAINGVDQKVADNKSAIDALSSSVESNYATKAYVQEVSGNIKTTIDGVSTALEEHKTAADNKFATKTEVTTLSGNAKTAIDGVDAKVTALDTKLTEHYWTSAETNTKIEEKVNAAVSSVYKVKGSVQTYDALPATGNVEGDVYNVVDAHDNIPAGTNYVWVSEGEGAGHWDPLGGTVDLSAYAKTTEVEAKVKVVADALDTYKGEVARDYALKSEVTTLSGNAHSAIETVSGAVKTLEGKLTSDYATSADTVAAIEAVSKNAADNLTKINELSGSVYDNYATKAYVQEVSGSLETAINGVSTALTAYKTEVSNTYATKQALADEKAALEQSISQVDGKVDSLENKLTSEYATSAQTVTALEGKLATAAFGTVETDASSSAQSGAKMKVSDNGASKSLTIDLTELIIDCGTF